MIVFNYLLFPLFLIYRGIVVFRNWLYEKRIFKSSSFDFPLITIGNLSMGGTGKTPHTEYLIKLLQDDYSIATLSRGYGRKTNEFMIAEKGDTALMIGDEPLQYFLKFPKIQVTVEKKRVLGILYILHFLPKTEVILLDDAFQHRALNAGLNILITDFSKPFYKDSMPPFGELREPISGADRANIIIVSKCPESLTNEQRNNILTSIKRPQIPVFFSTMKYGIPYAGKTSELLNDSLHLYEIVLVTGIANPQPIYDYLTQQNVHYIALKYNDHHKFTDKDCIAITEKFGTFTTSKKLVLTTEKDYARMMHIEALKDLPIYCLPIEVKFLDKSEQFDELIKTYVRTNKRDSLVSANEDELSA
jgi:tetraacyldisaccharide 4'-kinase